MEQGPTSSLVDIIVRNVYTPSQSISLSVDPTMLIGDLKTRLSLAFPLHPPVASQKLIFGGKLCADDEQLTQVLGPLQKSQEKDEKKSRDAVVFHLLVNSRHGPTDMMKQQQQKQQQATAGSQTPSSEFTAEAPDSPRPRVATATAATTTAAAAVRNQGPLWTREEQQHFVVGQSVLMQQQTLVLQQIQYLEYLLLQQQQHEESMSTREVPHVAADAAAAAPFAPPYGPFYGIIPPPMFQARPEGLPPARASNETRPNRSMGGEMVREVCALLDFRMALKMAFMLFIIGQDMPTDRILMLGLLALISYLHITGIFTKIYDVYNRHRSVHDGTAPDARTDPDAPGAAAAAGAALVNRCGVLTRVLRIPADRGLVIDLKSFVVGLLLSLVPTWHPQPLQGAAPMRENALPNDMPIQEI